jgi:4-hydroxybutyryl-CoA dehydratase/vinylacetyl-CoA-Delta-isomerase
MTCGGTCKVGFMNQIIGACKLIQEYKGLDKASHINDQLMEMVALRETCRACGMAAAQKGSEEPKGSGVYLPDELMGNVSKLNVANSFWRIMALAGDIGAGLIVTLPSLKELKNPEVGYETIAKLDSRASWCWHMAWCRPCYGPKDYAPEGY